MFSSILKSRILVAPFCDIEFVLLLLWFEKTILGGNTNSELCSIMLQSHMILELLFANSFSKLSWITKKTAQLLLEKCVQNPTLLLSQFCYSEDFFCSLKKTKRDAWLVLNYFCISIISVLFKRKKQKILKTTLEKNSTTKKDKNFCLFWLNFSHALISQVVIFELK